MKSWFIALTAAFLLSGCLGGSSDSDSGSTGGTDSGGSSTYADIAGLWDIEYTEDGDTYEAVMILTSDGKAVINDLDAAIYGTASVSNGKLTIKGHSYYDSVVSVTITGTANPDKMNLTAVSTDGNVSVVATRDQEYKDLYNEDSSLAGLAGTYSDDPDFDDYSDVSGTAVIDEQGNLTFKATGCTVTGELTTINTAFNEYAIEFDTAGCTSAFTSGIYSGVAVRYENSQGKQGLFATGVLGTQEAIWFVGVK